MGNSFVDYLNSMNNSGANTIAALAEAQFLFPYYDKIKVERCLGHYIADKFTDKKKYSIILTGHAGDGKTSILMQVLSELGMLEKDVPLCEEKLYDNGETKIYAVKDMSELPEDRQLEYFKKGLTAPSSGASSFLISNTGPLLKCFETIIKNDYEIKGKSFDESDRNLLQNTILKQLDENKQEEITIGDYSVLIINIARIDNVDFAEKSLDKILSDELWASCKECGKNGVCPIYYNRNVVKRHFNRISDFVTAYYRYLYENDKRMTIRQMLSQLSFAITGNLTCDKIKSTAKESSKFNNLFPNLFFGYSGLNKIESAAQIQGVAFANELRLDSIALKDDYKIFVTGDFSNIPEDVRELVKSQHDIFSKKHLYTEEQSKADIENAVKYRKALRRFYIMLSLGDENGHDSIFDELFGVGFNNYVKLLNGNSSIKAKNEIKKVIIDALYMETTGTASKNVDSIPLTIRRNDNVYQKVMITNGKLKKEDLQIEVIPSNNVFEDNKNKNNIVLSICGIKKYKLSLPLVIYFEKIAEGSISTAANPALTHGISNLKAQLLECGKDNSTGKSFKVMLNRTDCPQYIDMEFDEKKLYFN